MSDGRRSRSSAEMFVGVSSESVSSLVDVTSDSTEGSRGSGILGRIGSGRTGFGLVLCDR